MSNDTNPTKQSYFKQSINWMYGDDAELHKQVPEELGKKHINELLGRHPFYPFDPLIAKDTTHPCFETNKLFYECLSSTDLEEMPLHMKHVNCYFPYKIDHMKCLVKMKRDLREQK